MAPPLIRSGVFVDDNCAADYRAEHLGDVLVERMIWGEGTSELSIGTATVRGPGYVWYRFWLPAHGQVVERYFREDATPIGTLVDVCGRLECGSQGCSAEDLLLDIWLAPEGGVTVLNEAAYEAAVRERALSAEQAQLGDRRLRELTAAIARGRFPPPLVRNWRIDPGRLKAGG